jgi:hypothetical protein
MTVSYKRCMEIPLTQSLPLERGEEGGGERSKYQEGLAC